MLVMLLSFSICHYVWAQENTALNQSSNQLGIQLDQTPIKEALRLLEQESGVSIVFNEQYLPDRTLSGNFDGVDVEGILERLLFASSLRIVRTGEYQVVITPEEGAKKQLAKPVEIQGIVRDKDTGLALTGATVYSKQSQKGVITDKHGQFSLDDLTQNQLVSDTLVIQFVGYKQLTIPAGKYQPDQVLIAELSIQSVSLNEVEVTANRVQGGISSEAVSQFRLVPKDLEWIPAGSDNSMIRALQLLPGISGGQDGRSELLIRGSTPFQHLFSLDGITLYNTQHLFGFSSAVNEDIIGSLELYKGGFPARFGGRISGVIEASGEQGNYDRIQASVGIDGLHASGKLNIPLAGKGAVVAAFRRSFNELFETRLYKKLLNSTLERTRDEENEVHVSLPPDLLFYQDLYTQSQFQLDKHTTFNATLYHSDDEFTYTYFEPSINISEDIEEPFFVSFDQRNSVHSQTFGVSSSIRRNWVDVGQFEVSFAHTRFTSNQTYFKEISGFDYLDIQDFFDKNEVRDYAAQVHGVFPIGNRLVADVGGWINDTRVIYSYLFDEGTDRFEDSALIRGGYGQVHLEISPGVLVTPGIRATSYTLFDDFYWEPRLRIQYDLNDNVQLKAAFGTYYQFVDRLDHLNILENRTEFWTLAQEEILPTRSAHRIVGIRWQGPSRFIDVEVFSNVLSNVSEWGLLTEGNLLLVEEQEQFLDGQGIQQGFEVLVQQTKGPIKGWASYAYTESERQLDGRNQNNWYPTSQDFRHTASLVAQYAIGRWQWSLSWQLASGQPFTGITEQFILNDPFEDEADKRDDEDIERNLFSGPLNGQRLRPGHRLDLSMKRSFLLKNVLLDVGVTIFNAYNYRSVWRRDYNEDAVPIQSVEYLSPGITPTFTLRISYL